MSKEQTNPAEDKKVTGSKLDQVNKDLEANQLKEGEQGQIQGGFAADSISEGVMGEEADLPNFWCNTNC